MFIIRYYIPYFTGNKFCLRIVRSLIYNNYSWKKYILRAGLMQSVDTNIPGYQFNQLNHFLLFHWDINESNNINKLSQLLSITFAVIKLIFQEAITQYCKTHGAEPRPSTSPGLGADQVESDLFIFFFTNFNVVSVFGIKDTPLSCNPSGLHS